MSPATYKSSIALGLVGVMVLGVGCTATRLGSTPKMNLAWWKKDDAAPGTRHDGLAPPSTTLTPTASLAATKPAATTPSTTSQPSRTPYQVDDEAVRVSEGPPSSRSFELSKQPEVTTPPASDDAVPVQRKSFGLPSTSPIAGTSASAPSGFKGLTKPTLPGDDAAKFDDLTNVPRSNSTGPNSSSIDLQLPTQTAQSAVPVRVVNPFAADLNATAPTPQRVPLPSNTKNSEAVIATETASGSVYTRTPYNSFAPKATAVLPQVNTTTPVATKPPTNMSPLQPLIPKTVPEEIRIPATSSSATIQVPDGEKIGIGGQIVMPPKSSSMPDALLRTQGSYAPGSVRGAQSSNLILPSSAPATSPETPAPKPILPATQTIAPQSTPTIGGGGSFNLSK